MKKNKVINIEPIKKYIMWEADTTDLPYDCILNVPIGVQVIYCENESVIATFGEGQYFNINPKKNKKSKTNVKIIVTNSEYHSFEISLAKINIPYVDYEDDAQIWTEFAVRATCDVKIVNPYELYAKRGNEFDGMTSQDFVDFCWEALTSSLESYATEVLVKESYMTLNSKLDDASKKITTNFDNILKNFGVRVDGAVSLATHFQDKYVAQRRQNLSDKAKARTEKEINREKMRINREEAEIINSLNMASGNNSSNVARKCQYCNSPVAPDAKFCAKCGKKIQ